jgi:RimJ/RimL family protein N-acetyltransferase
MFKLQGEISYLIPFDEKHLNDVNYLIWLRDYEVIKFINRLDYICPVDFDSVKEYCNTVIKSKNDIFLAIYYKKKDKFIGTIRVNNINWHTRIADIGILIGDKDYWGKGVAKDSIYSISKYLFEILGIRKLTAGLMDINPAMQKVFEKLGFQEEGVMRKADRFEGEYIDHIYMGCFKEEFNINYLNK